MTLMSSNAPDLTSPAFKKGKRKKFKATKWPKFKSMKVPSFSYKSAKKTKKPRF